MREPSMSRKRLRRWYRLKWVGLAASLALLIVLLLQPIEVDANKTTFWVFDSSLLVFHYPGGRSGVWNDAMVPFATKPNLFPRYRNVMIRASGRVLCLSVPLPLLLLLTLIGTGLLWRLDHRFPPGYCQDCGYDLTGNTSGVCPECGTPIDGRPGADDP